MVTTAMRLDESSIERLDGARGRAALLTGGGGCPQIAYDVAVFSQDLDRIVNEEEVDHRKLVRRAQPLIQQLVADMGGWMSANRPVTIIGTM